MSSAQRTLAAVALPFNDAINARDIDRLCGLMTDDHSFIDSAGAMLKGKDACGDAWWAFFEMFPNYRNIFDRVQVAGNRVTMLGRSVCSDPRLDGPAIWTASIWDGRIAAWRVDDDTADNRQRLMINGVWASGPTLPGAVPLRRFLPAARPARPAWRGKEERHGRP